MSNKKCGSGFESDFCKLASENGFWAHMLQGNKNGQPADVIIVKKNKAVLIDCKVCENDIFPMSRIEENQELAMTKWLKCGNEYACFALKISCGIYIASFKKLLKLKIEGIKQLNKTQILENSILFSDWVEVFNVIDCKQ